MAPSLPAYRRSAPSSARIYASGISTVLAYHKILIIISVTSVYSSSSRPTIFSESLHNLFSFASSYATVFFFACCSSA